MAQFPDTQFVTILFWSYCSSLSCRSLFKEFHEAAYKARTDALKLCKTYDSCLDAHDFIIGEPTVPPVAAMLNWLDNVEKQLRQ